MKTNISDLGLPIARQTNAEQVVQRILGLIQAGILVAGQQLPAERELASNLGVSRPTLREALRALSLMGALNIRQGGGVFVSALTSQDLLAPLDFYFNLENQRLETLFEAQIMLESEVARMAASKMTDALIEQLESCLKGTEPVLDALLAWFEMDTQFHIFFSSVWFTASEPSSTATAKPRCNPGAFHGSAMRNTCGCLRHCETATLTAQPQPCGRISSG
jgi:GntR family transcriptional regulator, transcriptional repressor for pyruvate dehydrogenase complex